MEHLIAPLLLFLAFTSAAYYILLPFLTVTGPVTENASVESNALQLRKMSLYKQIREAEFDQEMGLIDSEDYERTRTDLLAETAVVIHRLEGGSDPVQTTALHTQPTCPNCDDPITPGVKFCSNCGSQLAASCPQCGSSTVPGDRFCSSCGRGLLE